MKPRDKEGRIRPVDNLQGNRVQRSVEEDESRM